MEVANVINFNSSSRSEQENYIFDSYCLERYGLFLNITLQEIIEKFSGCKSYEEKR